MKALHVYDRPLCCPSGVCDNEADRELICFALSLQWLRMHGIETARFDLVREFDQFADNPVVRKLLDQHGVDCLPLILADERVVSSGRYPSRIEIADMAGIRRVKRKAFDPAVSAERQLSSH